MRLHHLLIAFVLVFIQNTFAESTNIEVRVLAKDAKFIGTSMEGAKVTITDSTTGKVLASGLTEGATGNTKTLMKTPKKRHQSLSSDDSAVFTTRIALEQPVKATVTATGPMNLGDNASSVSAEVWLIPGKHLDQGDGVLLEMPGFYLNSDYEISNNKLTVNTEVRMMCGCPIEPDGLWDANQYEIVAYLLKNGKEVERKTMKFVKTSQFTADFEISAENNYQLVTYAYDPVTSNTGVDKLTVNKASK